jgi:hypothetical protein
MSRTLLVGLFEEVAPMAEEHEHWQAANVHKSQKFSHSAAKEGGVIRESKAEYDLLTVLGLSALCLYYPPCMCQASHVFNSPETLRSGKFAHFGCGLLLGHSSLNDLCSPLKGVSLKWCHHSTAKVGGRPYHICLPRSSVLVQMWNESMRLSGARKGTLAPQIRRY